MATLSHSFARRVPATPRRAEISGILLMALAPQPWMQEELKAVKAAMNYRITPATKRTSASSPAVEVKDVFMATREAA